MDHAKWESDPRIQSLLEPRRGHPYNKWTGSHWRLVSLVDLGIPAGHPVALQMADEVLGWLLGASHRDSIQTINGLVRRCGSQEGNALGVCSRLGMANDPRVRLLAESLIEWQWPDGGWNCRRDLDAHHSSFYESLAPMWGLTEYHRATGDGDALAAAQRTAEFFLMHRLFRSDHTGEVINPAWLKLHYPLYWHYDILGGLRVLMLLNRLDDARAQEALDILESKRRPDDMWPAEACFWRKAGTKGGMNPDLVDWGRSGPNEMITKHALSVLKAAGRS